MNRQLTRILMIAAMLLGSAYFVAAQADRLPPGIEVIHIRQPQYLQKHGNYTKADIDAAEELAKIGDAEAENNLGVMLAATGSYKKAAQWYKKAGLAGLSTAMYNLGVLYFNGQGVPQDYATAYQWFQSSAKHGNPYAELQLGLMSYTGQGMPKDPEQEVYWYKKAATQGLPAAEYNLAVMYHNGDGTQRDDIRAYAWLLLADKGGVDTSEALPVVAQSLSADDIAKAQKLSRSLLGDPVP